jgi:hypothetical protein
MLSNNILKHSPLLCINAHFDNIAVELEKLFMKLYVGNNSSVYYFTVSSNQIMQIGIFCEKFGKQN